MFQDVSDRAETIEQEFGYDRLIDNVMLYWLTNSGPSSARYYWEADRAGRPTVSAKKPMTMPTGISMFPGEEKRLSERWARRRFTRLLHFNELPSGGHFAAMERPDLFVDEVRRTFATVRDAGA